MKTAQKHAGLLALSAAAFSCVVLACIGCGHVSHSVAMASAAAGEPGSTNDSSEALAVQTVVPTRNDLVVKFEQPGPVEASAQADLYAKVTGYVKKVNVDIGDTVTPDQVLLEIDVPDLVQELAYKQTLVDLAQAEQLQAQSGVQAAQAALDAHPAQLDKAQADVRSAESKQNFAKQQAERYARLAAQDATTRELADEKREQLGLATAAYESSIANRKAVEADKAILTAKLEAAKADLEAKKTKVKVAAADRERAHVNLEFAKLRAPTFDLAAGRKPTSPERQRLIVTRRLLDEGASVNSATSGRGDPIFTVCRVDQVTAVLRVPEKEAAAVRVGNRAMIRLAALGDREFEGRVARFSHALEEKSRTMRVEIDIDNPEGALYPGMYGPITLILREIKQALTVPAGAVSAEGGQAYVIQVREGKAHRVAVKIGYDDGRIVQISEGLQGDEEIAVSNKGQIAEGQPLEPRRNGAE